MNQLFASTSAPLGAIAYLKSLPAIRERCSKVYDLATQGKLEYFDYVPEKEEQVAEFCVDIIKRDFGSDYVSIPPHGRWRHFDVDKPRISELLAEWSHKVSDVEACKRLIDLFLVSVLLDAGAGSSWTYREEGGNVYSRSEGLAIASFAMFKHGMFSSDTNQPYRVDAEGLGRLSAENIALAMQVNESNPMVGMDGRATLISNLSQALRTNDTYFGSEGRPGNIIDYLKLHSLPSELGARIDVSSLWSVLIDGLAPIWPKSRTEIEGISLGDVWPCSALKNEFSSTESQNDARKELASLVPFHKLSQWLAYSLIEPLEKILKWKIDGLEFLTGLPEYRNGGLLVDFGVLNLRSSTIETSPSNQVPKLPPSHPAIIEWRAMTVIELDRIANLIRKKLNSYDLSLPQILESATWKGGREIAKVKRPATGGPPIDIMSDGTVF